MGEEIILSSRLWTSGYGTHTNRINTFFFLETHTKDDYLTMSRSHIAAADMFSPAQAVVGHIYFRRHQPKFWESVHRAFTMGVHNPLEVGPAVFRYMRRALDAMIFLTLIFFRCVKRSLYRTE